MNLIHHKSLQQALARATVKITVGGQFKGTGFFITADGFILTAYHVIGAFPPSITVETFAGESFIAQVDTAKSLPEQDLAVLTVATTAPQCVPLGVISSQQVTDAVFSVGYPLGDRADNPHLGFYDGTIFRLRGDGKIETDAVRGQGQSGGLLYHEASQRVIGVAVEGYKPDRMIAGLAQRLDGLFERWPALNQSTIERWNEQFSEQSLIKGRLPFSKPFLVKWGAIALVGIITLLLLVSSLRGCGNTTITQEVRDGTGVVNTGSGSVNVGK